MSKIKLTSKGHLTVLYCETPPVLQTPAAPLTITLSGVSDMAANTVRNS